MPPAALTVATLPATLETVIHFGPAGCFDFSNNSRVA
jgi:hypothetical protein